MQSSAFAVQQRCGVDEVCKALEHETRWKHEPLGRFFARDRWMSEVFEALVL